MNALKRCCGEIVNNSVLYSSSFRISFLVCSGHRDEFLFLRNTLLSSSTRYSTMSNLHLSKGSECPTLQNGVLRVYNMRFCPYAERTLLVLKAKNIKYELVNVHLKSKPDWFMLKNQFGKVPVLEEDGKILHESLATCDYLDEVHLTPPLYPEDPWARAVDKCLIGILNEKFTTPLIRSFYKLLDPTALESALEEVRKGLQVIEDEIAKRGTMFLGGSTPGMVDYMIWPWFERIPTVNSITGNEFCLLSKETFPLTINYIIELEKDEAVQSIQIPPEQHTEFFKSFLTGSPNYDIGIDVSNKESRL